MRPARLALTSSLALLAACAGEPTRPDGTTPSLNVSAAATFSVNSTADAVDAQPGNGVCRTAAGTCSLRAAIQEANARAGVDVINVPAGAYQLTLPEPQDGAIAGGSLNITEAVQITGAGAGRTIIDGGRRLIAIIAIGRVTAGA